VGKTKENWSNYRRFLEHITWVKLKKIGEIIDDGTKGHYKLKNTR